MLEKGSINESCSILPCSKKYVDDSFGRLKTVYRQH